MVAIEEKIEEKPVKAVPKKTPPKRPKLRVRGKDYSDEEEIAGEPCPSCGKGIQDEAILCLHCGYNIKTGKKAKVKKSAAPKFSAVANAKNPPKEKVALSSILGKLVGTIAVLFAVAFALVHFEVVTSGPVKQLVDSVVMKINGPAEAEDAAESE